MTMRKSRKIHTQGEADSFAESIEKLNENLYDANKEMLDKAIEKGGTVLTEENIEDFFKKLFKDSN